jgi:hypothetical protein
VDTEPEALFVMAAEPLVETGAAVKAVAASPYTRVGEEAQLEDEGMG